MALHIPTVTVDDLRSFHAEHFPHAPAPEDLFQVAQPEHEAQNPSEYFDEEDDGLGYYPDGVKRTLTDEQIAMFRHSEIQRIIQERRRRREVGDMTTPETDPRPAPKIPLQTAIVEQQPVLASAPTLPGQSSISTVSAIDKVANGRVEKPQQNWVKAGPKTKARNAKNRKKNRLAHRKRKKEEKKKMEGAQKYDGQEEEGEEDEESDEWDPWHQANGPDAQKDNTVDLDY